MVKPNCISSSSTSPTENVSDNTSSSSKYKGVRKRKWGKWVSEIRLPNSRERIWLGSYDSAEKAARAFDAALYCLRGGEAKFNFPENPPEIVGGRSLSPQEIQAVAARFAHEAEAAGNNNNNNNHIDDNDNNSNIITSNELSHSRNNNIVGTELNTTSSSSVSASADWGAPAAQVESTDMMDYSFLSTLDTDQGMSDYGFYPGLYPGDQFYPPPIPSTPPVDDNVDDENGGEGFSQSSFLWNF